MEATGVIYLLPEEEPRLPLLHEWALVSWTAADNSIASTPKLWGTDFQLTGNRILFRPQFFLLEVGLLGHGGFLPPHLLFSSGAGLSNFLRIDWLAHHPHHNSLSRFWGRVRVFSLPTFFFFFFLFFPLKERIYENSSHFQAR